ncbi:MAG: hypothetical protein IJ767_07170 [Bacteroidaceae bacterium]|nr:hypothetical protein [Bacteroidaceae bacterium]
MDYKYIEQLIERYWNAATTPEEEQILRLFFRQSDIPQPLLRYKDLFGYEMAEGSIRLGSDFDQKVLAAVDSATPVVVKARHRSWAESLRPLYQAAAAVAVVVLVGIGAQRSFQKDGAAWDYNPASYSDTYDNPQQAYKVLEDGLEMFQRTASADTVQAGKQVVSQ